MAAPKAKEKDAPPKLSELRFRRLLKIKDRGKLYRFFIQVVRMLDKKCQSAGFVKYCLFLGR